MNRNESKAVVSIIAAALFALLAGCASVPSAEVAADDFFAEANVKP